MNKQIEILVADEDIVNKSLRKVNVVYKTDRVQAVGFDGNKPEGERVEVYCGRGGRTITVRPVVYKGRCRYIAVGSGGLTPGKQEITKNVKLYKSLKKAVKAAKRRIMKGY